MLQELLGKMDEAGVRQVLADVVDKQPGLLFDLLDYSAIAGAGYHPSTNAQTPSWCVYCHCREMRTDMESVCCGYKQEHCVSQLPVSNFTKAFNQKFSDAKVVILL